MSKRTAVYRFYDTADVLLYVGISSQPVVRWKQHAREKPWWPHVARRDVAWYDDRRSAATEEMRAIGAETPQHNVVGPPVETQSVTYRLSRDVYERLRRESFERHESMNAILCRALRGKLGMTGTEPSESEDQR